MGVHQNYLYNFANIQSFTSEIIHVSPQNKILIHQI